MWICLKSVQGLLKHHAVCRRSALQENIHIGYGLEWQGMEVQLSVSMDISA